jgi:hypothetical protein
VQWSLPVKVLGNLLIHGHSTSAEIPSGCGIDGHTGQKIGSLLSVPIGCPTVWFVQSGEHSDEWQQRLQWLQRSTEDQPVALICRGPVWHPRPVGKVQKRRPQWGLFEGFRGKGLPRQRWEPWQGQGKSGSAEKVSAAVAETDCHGTPTVSAAELNRRH